MNKKYELELDSESLSIILTALKGTHQPKAKNLHDQIINQIGLSEEPGTGACREC